MADEVVGQDRVIRSHARKMMAKRGIPEAAVDWVLEHYGNRRPAPVRPPARPAEILEGDFNGRELWVYIVRDSNPPIVKTAAWGR